MIVVEEDEVVELLTEVELEEIEVEDDEIDVDDDEIEVDEEEIEVEVDDEDDELLVRDSLLDDEDWLDEELDKDVLDEELDIEVLEDELDTDVLDDVLEVVVLEVVLDEVVELLVLVDELDVLVDALVELDEVVDEDEVFNWIVQFEESLKTQTNKWQMPYSSANYWNTCVAYSTRWQNRRVFPANWTTRDYPVVPNGWVYKQGDTWQWEADGNKKAAEYGSTGGDPDMDLDRWYGTVEQFNPTYGTHITHLGTPPIPPTPGQVPENIIITTGELAIHNTPQAIQTNIVGHALYNTIWHPYEEVYQNGIFWYRVAKDGFISKAYTRLP